MSLAPPFDFSRPFASRAEMAAFVAAFETCTLPCECWNHRAHLTVGLWHLAFHPTPVALNLLRAGIKRYNLACGWPTTARGGYHETLTQFWVWAIGCFLAEAPPAAPIHTLCPQLFNSRYGDKTLPFQYYSRDYLLGWEARVSWQPPDLCPLDEHGHDTLITGRFLC